MGDTLDTGQDPQWMPNAMDSGKPCIQFSLCIPMMKVNLSIRHSKRLATVTTDKNRTIITT